MKGVFHLYDFDRTALDGCRTLCGLHTTQVAGRWVGRPSQARRRICASCLKVRRARKRGRR